MMIWSKIHVQNERNKFQFQEFIYTSLCKTTIDCNWHFDQLSYYYDWSLQLTPSMIITINRNKLSFLNSWMKYVCAFWGNLAVCYWNSRGQLCETATVGMLAPVSLVRSQFWLLKLPTSCAICCRLQLASFSTCQASMYHGLFYEAKEKNFDANSDSLQGSDF